MYIKNSRNSSKIKSFGSYQTLCLTEYLVLRNRLLFIYQPLGNIQRKPTAQTAHLVFADTKANAEKPKELFFCQSTDGINEI